MNFNLYRLSSQAFNWLVPNKCYSCKIPLESNDAFCLACRIELPFQHHTCRQCGQALAVNSDICGKCIKDQPYYDHCFCPFEYQTPISNLICDLKYNDKPELAKKIGRLLANEIVNSDIPLPEALIPVPIHRTRLSSRGFNQAKLIAKSASKSLQVPIIENAVIKQKASLPQANQSLIERKTSLNNCFKLNKEILPQSVAIIDDVVTTGSTVNEIAKILKKNGVNCVQVWGVAHTL